jgi:hypothetical protein
LRRIAKVPGGNFCGSMCREADDVRDMRRKDDSRNG